MKKLWLVMGLVLLLISGGLLVLTFCKTSDKNSVKLVEGFPDVPVYPSSQLVSSVSETGPDGIYYSSTWEIEASVSDISEWYVKSLPVSGWVIDVLPADTTASDIQNIISVKADKTLNLGIIKETDGNSVKIVAEFFPPVKDVEVIEETAVP